MRKSLLTAAIVTTLIAAGSAFAAQSPASSTSSTASTSTSATSMKAPDMSATGMIKSYDSKTRMLTLDDGTKYKLGSKVNAKNIKNGETVTLTYHTTKKGTMLVTKYKVS
jgi:hypothetical protein